LQLHAAELSLREAKATEELRDQTIRDLQAKLK
jgi:hypothetical protein